jgi:CRISPR-associated endonuclease Csn1
VAVDGMGIAKLLYDEQLTPGEYVHQQLADGNRFIPDFYASDLQEEFTRIWNYQSNFYPNLSLELYEQVKDTKKIQTGVILRNELNLDGIKLEGSSQEKKEKLYGLRTKALSEKIDLEHLVLVLQEINNDKNNSSGYLGKISDRSKILYIEKKTVGQYLYEQVQKDPHKQLKNQVFYRQDYLDEFERIWETQAKYHKQLTPELKEEIRDVAIFYQRKLKSQKGLLSFCVFESWEEDRRDKDGNIVLNKLTGLPKKRTVGKRVIPKSSPLFQEFRIWADIQNLRFTQNLSALEGGGNKEEFHLNSEHKKALFNELNLGRDFTEAQLLKLFNLNTQKWKSNLPIENRKTGKKKSLQGNQTNKAIYNVLQTISELEGYGFDWKKKSAMEIKEELEGVLPQIGIAKEILEFDAMAEGSDFDKQPSYQLWHLLYSYNDEGELTEEDRLIYGNTDAALKKTLHLKYGFKPDYAQLIANIRFDLDYGNLSSKAIRNILPYLMDEHDYSEACALAGYNHSNSLTKAELRDRVLKDKLEILPKNSLRNPVVEKILNQMVNLVNQAIDAYGKPDEVRIELARELKKTAKEREEATRYISEATTKNDEVRNIIKKEFGFNATKTDIVRYKLWQELEANGYKTVFTNTYIPKEKLFSKEIEIEHIIPKSLLFDDSFSNKTLAYSKINKQKDNRTAIDFISEDFQAQKEDYIERVNKLLRNNAITRAKYKKLLMTKANLPEDFLERDLRNSQYIAKRAKQMLFEVFPKVTSTSGGVTDKLRSDWDLINVMKELNLPKYRALGLTEKQTRWDVGQEKEKTVEIIKDWTKRNDQRHHAMDALTVAFTTNNHINYINNLSSSLNKNSELYGVRNKITKLYEQKGDKKKRKFIPPMDNFRQEAKRHIEEILVSYKAKNKVVTRNINKTKKQGGYNTKVQLTPRGQLHKETVYGRSLHPMDKPTKLNNKFTKDQAESIIHPMHKKLVLEHLSRFKDNPKEAFSSKSLKSYPILYKAEPLKEVLCREVLYTIRKPIGPDLKIDKVVDKGVKTVLQKRLTDFNNKPKEAFSNLEENPIWLNEEKGIKIKSVRIKGVNNVEALHDKKDHFGNVLLNKNNKTIPADFISTGNNHHVAIYKDDEGNLQEKVVSFYEAVIRKTQGLPLIDKTYKAKEGWEFLFTLKQNEMFVFPSTNFLPNEVDLTLKSNYKLICEHLYRVQKFTSKDYFFRHHLETTVDNNKNTKNKAWIRTGLTGLEGIVKVRINHIGDVIFIGEY